MIRRVHTENGWVRGLPAADPQITSYKGIPYAAKPIGPNRWRAPQPCPDWEDELFAADFGPIAMQDNTPGDPQTNVYAREWPLDPDMPMSEDCLYLNIWTPASGEEHLPVFVWFHGGGLQVGNTAEKEFDGERIARRGIVVVTLGYRLNAFGFLYHPDMRRESPDGFTNFGLLDQQCALRWVQRNIAAFGGDPDNVTIGGQSAGAMSVSAQMTCEASRGLFHRGIVESGTFITPFGFDYDLCMTLEEAEERGVRFFEELGVSTLEQARALDASVIVKAATQKHWGCWGQIADGVVTPCRSLDWFLRQNRIHCPLLLGRVGDEFNDPIAAKSEQELRQMAKELFADDAEAYLALLSRPITPESIRRETVANSVEFGMRAAAMMNEASDTPQPFYGYIFAADIPGWDHPGAFHSVDLWFFFETLAKCWRPFKGEHYDLARQMCDYWANFIKTGDPNGQGSHGETLPKWPVMQAQAPSLMVFTDHPQAKELPANEMLRFLLKQYFRRKQIALPPALC